MTVADEIASGLLETCQKWWMYDKYDGRSGISSALSHQQCTNWSESIGCSSQEKREMEGERERDKGANKIENCNDSLNVRLNNSLSCSIQSTHTHTHTHIHTCLLATKVICFLFTASTQKQQITNNCKQFKVEHIVLDGKHLKQFFVMLSSKAKSWDHHIYIHMHTHTHT